VHRKAPAKRSQHINTTYLNIVGPAFARSDQTISTFQHNIWRHCWARLLSAFGHPVATCCDILGIENRTSAHAQVQHCCIEPGQTTTTLSPGQTIATCQRNMLRAFGHSVVTCCDMLGVVGSNLTSFKLEPTTPNMSQHVATRWPNARSMLRPTMLQYVALTCCDRWPGFYATSTNVKPRPNDRNISAQHFATLLGATCCARLATQCDCCDMLGIENRTSAHARVQHCCTNLAKRLQHYHATPTNGARKI